MLNSLRIVSVVVVAAAGLDVAAAQATIMSDGLTTGAGAGSVGGAAVVARHDSSFDQAASATRQGVLEFDADGLSAKLPPGGDLLFDSGVIYRNAALRGLRAGEDVTITGLRRIEPSWPASPDQTVRVPLERLPASAAGPTTVALLGLGLAALGLRQRHSRRRAG
jgi:hypothetical protein